MQKKSQTSKILGDQLIRSITSIRGNYIERHAASFKKTTLIISAIL